MTTITINKSKNGEYKKITCSGHAGYANVGNDIVCSAVSILVINTINSIEELTTTKAEIESNQMQGLIDCRFIHKPDEKAELLIDSMILGLQNVAEQYGKKYLELKFKEV